MPSINASLIISLLILETCFSSLNAHFMEKVFGRVGWLEFLLNQSQCRNIKRHI
ncbi:hypothetical protein RchiOBHm_Chr7g0198911 [Rosa chinensis]|uniref:Uncharacterized protein n=1 Tax=Rosa chinensis TaxID=74649 RepID=A0A2P6P789_ROSCH|nr:hypothetical protein RchiOBHm_Chr7g0198911 [Rosa chinensis]